MFDICGGSADLLLNIESAPPGVTFLHGTSYFAFLWIIFDHDMMTYVSTFLTGGCKRKLVILRYRLDTLTHDTVLKNKNLLVPVSIQPPLNSWQFPVAEIRTGLSFESFKSQLIPNFYFILNILYGISGNDGNKNFNCFKWLFRH